MDSNIVLKCVAIDDEPLGLKLVANYVSKTEGLELVQTFTDALAAEVWLRENEIDLLFLDIQMPDITGIELFKQLDDKMMVIFTTAYSQYAVEGFDLDAIDYLLKPFEYTRFLKAVNKAKELHNFLSNKNVQPDFIYLKFDYQWNKIQLEDIIYIEALDDYVKIYLQNAKPVLIHSSMKAMMEKLPETSFLRIHRSYIVAINYIQKWNKNFITIQDKEFSISSGYQRQVQNVLEKMV